MKHWALVFRDSVDAVATTLKPYVSIVVPNFRAAHYVYVLSWAILGSIFIYPVKNMAYIDALFFATGASTQSGLNTVDVNTTALWQQMVLYVVASLTTPIFIHGSLLFIRLYYFERYFDNIKEISKKNHMMRRSGTIGGTMGRRTRTNDTTGLNTMVNTGYGGGTNTANSGMSGTNGANGGVNGGMSGTSGAGGVNGGANTANGGMSGTSGGTGGANTANGTAAGTNDGVNGTNGSTNTANGTAGNDTIQLMDLSPVSPATATATDDKTSHESYTDQPTSADSDIHIQFPGNLDHPSRHKGPNARAADGTAGGTAGTIGTNGAATTTSGPGTAVRFDRRNYEPSDMYRSIELLQQSKLNHDDDDEVLIIKSPNQIETDGDDHPIFTRKLSFDHKLKPKFRSMRARLGRRAGGGNSGSAGGMGGMSGSSVAVDSEDDDNDSIDSASDSGSDGGSDEEITSSSSTGSHGAAARRSSHAHFGEAPHPRRDSRRRRRGTGTGIGTGTRTRSRDEESLFTAISRTLTTTISRQKTSNYLSWEPTIGRNSNFVHLTDEQKEELGGVEYRAIKLLIKIVWSYYVGLHAVAAIVFLAWILAHKDHQHTLRGYGVSPAWWGFFTAQTCFNDLGYTLNPNSLIDYNRSSYVMLWGAFFIVVGNTGFPVLLRFIIWILYKFATPASLFEESLAFLLDHPRRCFTLLFPSGPTWWLFAVLVVLNGVDLIFFIILDLKNSYLEKIPAGYRVIDGLFNAISTRTAGLSVIDLSQLHSAVQVSYMVMMYISVLPIAISIRRTNVYEEQSLGVYLRDGGGGSGAGSGGIGGGLGGGGVGGGNYGGGVGGGIGGGNGANNGGGNLSRRGSTAASVLDDEKSPTNFIGNHLRNQLSFDLWFVFLGLFFICIAENSKLERGDLRFNVFTILFEVVSAYGTVGLSLGYPTTNTSFSGELTVVSKLIIIAMMVRGRHRGLPYALDRAIMLPNDNMARRDEVQQHHELRRQETLERGETVASGSRLWRALSRRGDEILARTRTR